jgi:hypothetical protein
VATPPHACGMVRRLKLASPRVLQLNPRKHRAYRLPPFVLDNAKALSILRGCFAATRGEIRTPEKAMTSRSMEMTCRYLLK